MVVVCPAVLHARRGVCLRFWKGVFHFPLICGAGQTGDASPHLWGGLILTSEALVCFCSPRVGLHSSVQRRRCLEGCGSPKLPCAGGGVLALCMAVCCFSVWSFSRTPGPAPQACGPRTPGHRSPWRSPGPQLCLGALSSPSWLVFSPAYRLVWAHQPLSTSRKNLFILPIWLWTLKVFVFMSKAFFICVFRVWKKCVQLVFICKSSRLWTLLNKTS